MVHWQGKVNTIEEELAEINENTQKPEMKEEETNLLW